LSAEARGSLRHVLDLDHRDIVGEKHRGVHRVVRESFAQALVGFGEMVRSVGPLS